MREIKFRAWLKETKEMIPVYQIDFNNGIVNSESAWRMESEYILEQFTGRLDKNSREIYEGDIVRIEDSSDAIIEYSKLEAMFIFNFIGKWKIYGTWNTARKDIEVIGNIHEEEQPCTSAIVE